MNVTREVIVDLLPLYLAGEASPGTRALVEEYLRQDVEFGRDIRRQMLENLAGAAPPALPPELELKALRRTRGVLDWQRRLFGMAILFSLLPFSSSFTFHDGRLVDAHLLARDYPVLAALSILAGLALWTAYWFNRRRLRTVV